MFEPPYPSLPVTAMLRGEVTLAAPPAASEAPLAGVAVAWIAALASRPVEDTVMSFALPTDTTSALPPAPSEVAPASAVR
ncbi:MAG: hypothetical protein LBR80_14570 [Deltaproteobacteria bacterium]|jgi:hypothetical protein|nr:hypothetical protein [Deltaproteobacteria bacterium]